MTKAEAHKLHREVLKEVDRQDPRTTPVDVKFRQLDKLTRAAQILDLPEHTEEEIQAVRQLWVRLKTKCLDRNELRSEKREM
ncbi:MAG: hypothetical protein ACE5EQ_01670 [Phycisphaerae bacterium]